MSKMIVGLTGGIGSGKSIAAKQFARLNVTVIDADKIACEIVKPNTHLFKKIVKKFGNGVLHADGSLNRALLRQIIFSDQNTKSWLEKLLHPVILHRMISQAKQAKSPYCILVIPLLFEAKLTHLVDRVLVIDAPKKLRAKRIQKRSHLSLKEIQTMMNAQISRKERLMLADDVIKNTTTLPDFSKQIKKLHKFYLTQS
jgi:dephospho-CoA kinase